MALAALTAGVMHELLPTDFQVGNVWVYPILMGLFLVLLIAGDPELIDRERRWLRLTTGLMIARDRAGEPVLGDPTRGRHRQQRLLRPGTPYQLLQIGGIVWATNVIAFALWYWDVDGGGSAVKRAVHGAWHRPRVRLPRDDRCPTWFPKGWYPHFADYLALAFATATAFSPTDVSAIKRWAKMLMVLEAIASLVLATLVLAKAINGIGTPVPEICRAITGG